jgi:hypothetical protein
MTRDAAGVAAARAMVPQNTNARAMFRASVVEDVAPVGARRTITDKWS